MNSTARTKLTEQLTHLKERGDSMSMLVITVRQTSNGVLAGIRNGEISLDYPKAGWLDITRSRKFRLFCKARGFKTQKEKWGKERVIRANIGADVGRAVEAIDACFSEVYGESGPFGLELRGFGWQPANSSFESDAMKTTRASN